MVTHPGRHVFLGWMNNWTYSGDVPCSPWRSAFTLPRDLSLIDYQGSPLLSCRVSPEVEKISGEWQTLDTQPKVVTVIRDNTSLASAEGLKAYHLQVTFALDAPNTVTLSNEKGERYELAYSTIGRKLSVARTSQTGVCVNSFSMPSLYGPLRAEGDEVTLDIYVDQSSVEVFTANGSMAMTNLVFPQNIYNQVTLSSAVKQLRYRPLLSIW